MRFREVERNIEKEKINRNKEESYKKIKLDFFILYEEANAFWDELFMNMAKES